MEWIPSVSPKYVAPWHLAPAAAQLAAFEEKPFEFCFSVPPRHGKTLLLLHFIVWALLRRPWLNICYVTYNAEQAVSKSNLALSIADRAGLQLVSRSGSKWRTSLNEHVLWTGVGGSITGKGFDICLFDDPVKNRAEAESPISRERVWDFYQNDLVTRMEPGSSFAAIMTRWHPNDILGRLTTPSDDFEALPYTNIPAITVDQETGTEKALWPARWPVQALAKRRKRVGEYAWASLFMGHPVPRGTTVFGEPTFYSALPIYNFQAAQGFDIAYTEKKTADYSVVVTMYRWVDPSGKADPLFFVTRCLRVQKRAPDFKRDFRSERMPNVPCRIYAAGTELGALDFFRTPDMVQGGTALPGIPFQVLPPKGDKYVRAMDLAEAWNLRRVLIPAPELANKEPHKYGWVHDFIDELRAFTGVKDAHDDQVDATVAAFDLLNMGGLKLSDLAGVSAPRRM